jgi:CRP-like cAMP-binding protein
MPGDCQRACLDRRNTASHRGGCLSDSQLLRLDRKSFKRILDEYPEIAASLYDRIADDLQAMVARLERLSSHFEN